MAVLQYEAAAAQRLLNIYRTPDVVHQRTAFVATLDLRSGEHVLDVGCGPGLLAQTLAQTVGPSGAVTGIDVSDSLLDHARTLSMAAPAIFLRADATALPMPDASVDVVVSTQVLEYVPDVAAALAEMWRVLRPGGRVALLDTDWDSIVWHGPDPLAMEQVLALWQAHAAHVHLPRTLVSQMRAAGFAVESCQVIPLFNPYWDTETYSVGMIGLIEAYLCGRGKSAATLARRWAADLLAAGRRGEWFFSLNRYAFNGRKGS